MDSFETHRLKTHCEKEKKSPCPARAAQPRGGTGGDQVSAIANHFSSSHHLAAARAATRQSRAGVRTAVAGLLAFSSERGGSGRCQDRGRTPSGGLQRPALSHPENSKYINCCLNGISRIYFKSLEEKI